MTITSESTSGGTGARSGEPEKGTRGALARISRPRGKGRRTGEPRPEAHPENEPRQGAGDQPGTADTAEAADTAPGYDYARYSRLAGPLRAPGGDRPHRVRYQPLLTGGRHRTAAVVLLVGAPLMSGALILWLALSHRSAARGGAPGPAAAVDAAMLISLSLLELFRLVNVVANALATLVARDPVPVTPLRGVKVAFVTTFVPGKEPLAMVRATLEGARAVRHKGRVDVWLLDEGDDPEVKKLCARLKVRHFSRKGVARWNQPTGPYRARTKHGNYNAWLDAHGAAYTILASVDTDHVPHPDYLRRTLGYFRDPDVAFVVGPQVYGNYTLPVTKGAESQQFLFHSLIQRAGNAYRSPMFVGTNNCVRLTALRQGGGFYDSITEDLATGLRLHCLRNPDTGRRWCSVYTPDVLAVGEGPTSWTDFFTQQLRWSRGTYETLLKQFWKVPFRLPPGRLLNYALLVAYYPLSALAWVTAAVTCALSLGMGAQGIATSSVWLMLFVDASAFQLGLYLWNRRHNVSPHEPPGSAGVAGIAMSALCAPLYARALLHSLLRRTSGFVVTPKGNTSSPDSVATFRTHLTWAALFAGLLLASFALGNAQAATCGWAALALLSACGPALVWRGALLRARRRERTAENARTTSAARGVGEGSAHAAHAAHEEAPDGPAPQEGSAPPDGAGATPGPRADERLALQS